MNQAEEIRLINQVNSIKRSVDEIHAILNVLVEKKKAKSKADTPEKSKEERVADFKHRCNEEFSKNLSQATINDFCDYWTESSENSKKLRFEREKVFDIKRRMATWLKNNKKIMPSSNGVVKASGFTVMN